MTETKELEGASPVHDTTPHHTSEDVLRRAETAPDIEREVSGEQRAQTRQMSAANLMITRTSTAKEMPSFTLLQEALFVGIIASAQLLTQAGLAQAVAPLHVIGESLGTTNPGQLSWLAAGYSLTVGTFILIAGRWGDLFGHKLIFLIGYFWFAVWSLVAGFTVYSHSIPFFTFCRAMQGIGPALLLPNGIAILGRIYPPGARKSMVLAIFGAAAPSGFVLGAIFSGVFAQLLWWPWAFYAMAITCVVAGGLSMAIIPYTPVIGDKPQLAELDLPGSFLGVLGLVLFNFSWNQAPIVGWNEPYVYVILIIGLVVLIAFFWVEAKISKYPLVPIFAFTRDTSLVLACIAAGWASFGIWVYYYWQIESQLRRHSILLIAARQIPAAISGACAAVATGFLIHKFQPGIIMLCSMIAFAVGSILLSTMSVEQNYWAATFVSLVVTVWGMDMSYPSGLIVLSNHFPLEHQGLAASILSTVVNYSISIGLGIGGTVEVHVNNGGRNILEGYRGAWYLGIGLDVLGVVFAAGLILSWRATAKAKTKAKEELTKELL